MIRDESQIGCVHTDECDEEHKDKHDGEDEAHEDERDKNRAPVMQALDFYYLENVFLSSSGGADARGTLPSHPSLLMQLEPFKENCLK